MRTLRWLGVIATLFVVAGLLPAQSARTSPFAGDWNGTYTLINSSGVVADSGDINLTVSRSGSLTGWAISSVSGFRYDLHGHIRADGKLSLAYHYVRGSESFGGSIRGQGTLDGDGLTVPIIAVATGGRFTGSFDLARS